MDRKNGIRFKKVLVTGAAGFAGHYLVRELESAGHEVVCLDAAAAESPAAVGLPSYQCVDLADAAAVDAAVSSSAPDAVIHLAAVSFIPDAAKNPDLLWAVNIGGTVHVVEALRRVRPDARFVFVSSAQVYGTTGAPGSQTPLPESAPLLPLSLYSISKVAGEAYVRACVCSRNLDAIIVRPSNHTGPGQSPKFVAVSFASQILSSKKSGASTMRVGNLDSVRDFSDVRDVVRAYRLAMEKGRSGAAYNISSGTLVSIKELLGHMFKIAGFKLEAVRDENYWRPTDRCAALSTDAIESDTGWKPQFSLDETLSGIFKDLDKSCG